MLDPKIPDAEYENIVLKPSDAQKEMVSSLADRAETVRNGSVDASVDNMLKITNDGRKLALDQRRVNDLLGDSEDNKTTILFQICYRLSDGVSAISYDTAYTVYAEIPSFRKAYQCAEQSAISHTQTVIFKDFVSAHGEVLMYFVFEYHIFLLQMFINELSNFIV